METKAITALDQRLPWRPPQFRRLVVSLRTEQRQKSTSTEDLEIKGAPGFEPFT